MGCTCVPLLAVAVALLDSVPAAVALALAAKAGLAVAAGEGDCDGGSGEDVELVEDMADSVLDAVVLGVAALEPEKDADTVLLDDAPTDSEAVIDAVGVGVGEKGTQLVKLA